MNIRPNDFLHEMVNTKNYVGRQNIDGIKKRMHNKTSSS